LFRRREQDPLLQDKQELLEELRIAHADWQLALGRFHYATEQDQIDYAIFAFEAAQKRYEMLLRRAKALQLHARHHYVRKKAGG
jgi:hypothetical protein